MEAFDASVPLPRRRFGRRPLAETASMGGTDRNYGGIAEDCQLKPNLPRSKAQTRAGGLHGAACRRRRRNPPIARGKAGRIPSEETLRAKLFLQRREASTRASPLLPGSALSRPNRKTPSGGEWRVASGERLPTRSNRPARRRKWNADGGGAVQGKPRPISGRATAIRSKAPLLRALGFSDHGGFSIS